MKTSNADVVPGDADLVRRARQPVAQDLFQAGVPAEGVDHDREVALAPAHTRVAGGHSRGGRAKCLGADEQLVELRGGEGRVVAMLRPEMRRRFIIMYTILQCSNMPPGAPGNSFFTNCLIHVNAVSNYRILGLASSPEYGNMLDSLRRSTVIQLIHQLV